MKHIILFMGYLTLFGCLKPKEFEINFCTTLTPEVECKPSLSTFKSGDRVYVLLECNQPISEKTITGNFYYIDNVKKIKLGSQDWVIKKVDSYAYDYVDFTERGIYEFEFVSENILLAKKRLEIK